MRTRFIVTTAVSIALGFVLTFVSVSRHSFHVHMKLAAIAHDSVRLITAQPYVNEDLDDYFVCWGDSLTEGYGLTFGHDFPSLLRSVYHRPSINEGVSRETSRQIKARMLARERTSGPESVVIWAGRNNAYEPDVVLQDIDDMVKSLNPGSRFLVVGLTNGNLDDEKRAGSKYVNIIDINRVLQNRYGTRFLPLREKLLNHANFRFATDSDDLRSDIVPGSLRSDPIHLNDVGMAIVAASIHESFEQNGW